MFKLNACGIVTARDSILISKDLDFLKQVKDDFIKLEERHFFKLYNLDADSRDWKYAYALNAIKENVISFEKINYKPFDIRNVMYSKKSKGIISYPRYDVMQHFINKSNIGIILNKQFVGDIYNHCTISKHITVKGVHYLGNNGNDFLFPLYLYPETTTQQSIDQTNERTPNLNPEIVNQIAKKLGLTFTTEKETTKGTFAPIDILDYIYAVLHSPTYRAKYKEFLKIDFPRVPYPKDAETFWQLVALGAEIRKIHLLESQIVEKYITQYPIDGDNVVSKIRFEPYPHEITIPDENGIMNYPDYLGAVYINDTQYFADVPISAWNFYIGGYQPAQKWLKDRKERTLEFDDILHYQKIIVALTETNRLMQAIDKLEIE